MAESSKRRRWHRLMSRFEQGDVGVTTFCREHRVPVYQFYYWRRVLGDELVTDSTKPQLIPVAVAEPVAQQTRATVRLPNGVTIAGLSDEQLAQALPALAAL